jgi:hypothetical protein
VNRGSLSLQGTHSVPSRHLRDFHCTAGSSDMGPAREQQAAAGAVRAAPSGAVGGRAQRATALGGLKRARDLC